ncbi:unnamed protein product [Sphenostylis stenocarpa]|uniref:Uncharacterized protein n=1 Tax=Sphenostylis stenocarpa TaxID=92480 RepID=A0AA86VFZ7_9FABA|nr:unnamed protein product [Sphenostylis stenocarpa]
MYYRSSDAILTQAIPNVVIIARARPPTKAKTLLRPFFTRANVFSLKRISLLFYWGNWVFCRSSEVSGESQSKVHEGVERVCTRAGTLSD